jgi:phthiodiolone/phenolphthiodiolone dimycocerosates ketoreductase
MCATLALGAPADVWRTHGLVHPLGETHRGFLDLVPSRITRGQIDRAATTMTPQLLLTLLYAGSARQISDEVAPLVDAGCDHLIIASAGASFMGEGAKGLWRLADLMRRLRRL